MQCSQWKPDGEPIATAGWPHEFGQTEAPVCAARASDGKKTARKTPHAVVILRETECDRSLR